MATAFLLPIPHVTQVDFPAAPGGGAAVASAAARHSRTPQRVTGGRLSLNPREIAA